MQKEKVRGLRRHFRNHVRRAAIAEPLDWSLITQGHACYHQLGLAPWNVHGRPPVAFRKLWASRLLADFEQWHRELSARGEPFHLSVSLYDQRFGLSLLVGLTDKCTGFDWCQNLLSYDAKVPLPPEYQSLPGAAQLKWTALTEVNIVSYEELEEPGHWAARKPQWEVQTSEGPQVAVQTGWRWVGRRV